MKFLRVSVTTLLVTVSTQAFAEECPVIYYNNADLMVKNDTSAMVGSAMFGLLGRAIASAANKPNDNDLEIVVKKKIEDVDTFSALRDVHPSALKSDGLAESESLKCNIRLKLNKYEVSYSSAAAIITMKFNVALFRDEVLSNEKDVTLQRAALSPIPGTPKPKYKAVSYGKWVNVAPPAPTQEEALSAFYASFRQELGMLYRELISKKLPK